MAAPIVTYYNEAGNEQVTEWNIGEIDAGSSSDHKIITVWNNKGGNATNISHMKYVTVTLTNEKGAATGSDSGSDIVLSQKWTHVKVNDGEDTPIGGETAARVHAIGVDPEVDGYMIKGDANDGTVGNALNNYAKYELWIQVPPNAPEGSKPCRLRTGYSYT